jgi:hypothetical protein
MLEFINQFEGTEKEKVSAETKKRQGKASGVYFVLLAVIVVGYTIKIASTQILIEYRVPEDVSDPRPITLAEYKELLESGKKLTCPCTEKSSITGDFAAFELTYTRKILRQISGKKNVLNTGLFSGGITPRFCGKITAKFCG